MAWANGANDDVLRTMSFQLEHPTIWSGYGYLHLSVLILTRLTIDNKRVSTAKVI